MLYKRGRGCSRAHKVQASDEYSILPLRTAQSYQGMHMPSLARNRRVWGSSQQQWQRALLPRLRAFLPTQTILEIAPGFGRWTEHLKSSLNSKRTGAFIPHSNLGRYQAAYRLQSIRELVPGMLALRARMGVDNLVRQWRDPRVSADKVVIATKRHGLKCIGQELINRETRRTLTDCISIFSRADSCWESEDVRVESPNFYGDGSMLPRLYEAIR